MEFLFYNSRRIKTKHRKNIKKLQQKNHQNRAGNIYRRAQKKHGERQPNIQIGNRAHGKRPERTTDARDRAERAY